MVAYKSEMEEYTKAHSSSPSSSPWLLRLLRLC
jgi:hypothetical protein